MPSICGPDQPGNRNNRLKFKKSGIEPKYKGFRRCDKRVSHGSVTGYTIASINEDRYFKDLKYDWLE